MANVRYPGLWKMCLIWMGIAAIAGSRYYPGYFSQSWTEGLAKLFSYTACYYPWIFLTPVVFRMERKFPLGTGKWIKNPALLVGISIPFTVVASILMAVSYDVLSYILGDSGWLPLHRVFWGEFPVATVAFWGSALGGYFIRALFQLHEKERIADRLALEKSKLEASLNQAQLEVLRARLNPHFLFNSLQNISVLVRQDPQMASRMLTRLGDILRMALQQDSQPECTLESEIKLTQTYVELEQMRFGERLQVDFEMDQNVQQAMVPCFLLQPLIENAIIHGLRGMRKTGVITIAAASQENELILTVTDNGVGPQSEDLTEMKLGLGLQSTSQRLEKMYPNRHSFSIWKPAECGTEVRIAIPLRLAEFEERASYNEKPEIADR
jgi:two-component system LytT family sensor kinase